MLHYDYKAFSNIQIWIFFPTVNIIPKFTPKFSLKNILQVLFNKNTSKQTSIKSTPYIQSLTQFRVLLVWHAIN